MSNPFFGTSAQFIAREIKQTFELIARLEKQYEALAEAAKTATQGSQTAKDAAIALKNLTEANQKMKYLQEARAALSLGTGTGASSAAAGGAGLVSESLTSIGSAISGGALSGGAALAVGGLALTAVLGVLTWGASTYLGGLSGDQPIQPGPRMTGQYQPPLVSTTSPPPTTTSPTAGRGIHVISGTYGGNCKDRLNGGEGNTPDKTAHLRAACEGKDVCEYSVVWQAIGDPAYGCKKDYVAVWQCAGGQGSGGTARAEPEAGYGSKVALSCN
jgi:hypothetical protein